MWKAIGNSVAGTSHEKAGVPCQDYSRCLPSQIGGELVMVIGISDGAGSASLSHMGSEEVVGLLLRQATSCDRALAEIGEKDVRNWFANAQAHLKSVAEREKLDPRDFACTALLAILGDQHAVFAQIGDGAWIAEASGALGAVTWPQSGEFANETKFITSPDALDSLQFQKCTTALTAAAGFTDGIQTLALNLAARTAHAPFFEGMFGALRDCPDETSLLSPLISFLSSEPVNQRTDDDKTLVLARRAASKTAESELG
jgi:serine/threonine protein phosphatase PrpC